MSFPAAAEGQSQMVNLAVRKRFVFLGLSLVLVIGCDSQNPASKREPSPSPANRPLEHLEKDLKPPVIIKPNVPSPNGTEPAQPERNPN